MSPNKKGLLKVDYVAVKSVKPSRANTRAHPPEQIAQIIASIKEFGWTKPIIVDERREILAGHGAYQAAQQMGLTEVPIIARHGLSPAQRAAYRMADNKIGENSLWDTKILASELAALQELGFNLELTGFKPGEIEALLRRDAARGEVDDAPPRPAKPITRLGDVWLLGTHRLLCGDATSAEAVGTLLNGTKPGLMVTDPPYGVSYNPNWRNEAAKKGHLAHADRRVGKVSNDDRDDWSAAWALYPGDVAYVWHADRHASVVQRSIESAGFEIRCQLIWAKSNFPISRGHYHWRHEPCWYAVRVGKTGNWHGDRKQTTLWEINLDSNADGGHSTQKPCECMERPMLNNSVPGDAVYDPFVGSGTTLIAAERSGRVCFAMDIDPAYVDVSVQRWQQFTGKQATHAQEQKTYEAIAKARAGKARAKAAA